MPKKLKDKKLIEDCYLEKPMRKGYLKKDPSVPKNKEELFKMINGGQKIEKSCTSC
ncbi:MULTISPECIES: hypothetical protein [Clostridium]|uniref:hypothetical protein n=1 Tax=Clostridium TaxID=1485 RepID=UPI000A86D5F6|nr:MULTISPECIES: hypothetical protein [Clostridium]MCD2348514.1 hypothetical protein [Clostridium guangxiense]